MTENTCVHCGRQLTGQHNFCPYCGGDMRPAAAVPSTAVSPAPPQQAKIAPSKKARPRQTSRRFRLFDRRTLFGLLGLLDIPIIILLTFLLLRPLDSAPPPSLICDDLDAGDFTQTRFERGLSGELDEDTLFAGGVEYLIQDTLTVPAGRQLLIQPGASLEFEEAAVLEIRGSLYVCGSEKEPVTFTSSEGEPGSWAGLRFIDADDASTISHALIQFAGDRAVYLENSQPTFFDVKITSSSAFPVSSDGNNLPETMTEVVLEKNPFDGIEIRGGTLADVQHLNWPNHGFVYVVSGLVEVGDNSTLVIDPGVTVKFWQVEQTVPGLRLRGLLKAEDVRFTSIYDSRDESGGATYTEARDPAAGDWAGISFVSSSDNATLRRTLVQYAGRGQSAIHLENSSPELADVTIADSASYPLSADADSFPMLTDLTLADNEPGDAFEIRGGSRITGRNERRWSPLGGTSPIVRVIKGEIIVEPEATLIVEPGVIVKFEPDGKLTVQGTLQAVGEDDDGRRIIFTSLRDDEYGGATDKNTSPQDQRHWKGIIFDKTDDSSILQNVLVRYSFIGANDASPRLLGNLIQESESAGIWLTPGATPTLRDNRLEDNAINGVAISQGRIEEDVTWALLGVEGDQLVRVLMGEVTVVNNATLQIESGTLIKADEAGRLVIHGQLDVLGQSDRPVIFTSLHDDSFGGDTNVRLREAQAGDWHGLHVSSGGDVSFDDALIRYAQIGLGLEGGAEPAIDGRLQITDGKRALWCNGRSEIPVSLHAEDNEDDYRQCPTE